MRVAVLIENQIRSRTEQVGVKTSKRLTGANLQQIQIWDQLHGRDNLPSPQHTHTFLLLVNGSTTLKVICYTVCTPKSTVSASK